MNGPTRTRDRVAVSLSILFSLLLSACGGQATAPSTRDPETYAAEIESWREERVAQLRSETGWLSLIGLYWLEPGETEFGSDPSNAIVIPDPEVPAVAGRLIYDGEGVKIASTPGSGVLVGGQPIAEKELADDGDGEADVVQVGRVSFYVIERIGLHAVRIRTRRARRGRASRGSTSTPSRPP
jgi:uncharacterized protein (DUF1684 family)